MKCLYKFTFILLLFVSCSLMMRGCRLVDNVVLDSNPRGATVYVIPRYDFEMDSTIITDTLRLQRFRIPEGVTPCTTRMLEKSYIVIFELNGKREQSWLDVINGRTNKATVEFK